MNYWKFGSFLLVAALVATSCKNGGKDPCQNDFDQLSMLSNLGNNIILPRYDSLMAKILNTHQIANDFVATPDSTNLARMRDAWYDASLAWQRASIFEFGPAADEELRDHLGNFPVFTDRVDDAIAQGIGVNDLLTDGQYAYARGLPSMEYMLYGIGATDSEILDLYDTLANPTANNYKQFLHHLTTAAMTKVGDVITLWDAGYKNTFTTTEGTATGTPVSNYINQLNAHYEIFKNDKLGTPIGAKTSYIPAPSKVEAYYSRLSLDFALEAVNASKDAFLGVAEGSTTNGVGLDDFLQTVEADKNGTALDALISQQYDLAINGLKALQPSSYYDAITGTQFEDCKTAYAHAQNQVVYLKTDLPSVLCVSITYIDNVDDGD